MNENIIRGCFFVSLISSTRASISSSHNESHHMFPNKSSGSFRVLHCYVGNVVCDRNKHIFISCFPGYDRIRFRDNCFKINHWPLSFIQFFVFSGQLQHLQVNIFSTSLSHIHFHPQERHFHMLRKSASVSISGHNASGNKGEICPVITISISAECVQLRNNEISDPG